MRSNGIRGIRRAGIWGAAAAIVLALGIAALHFSRAGGGADRGSASSALLSGEPLPQSESSEIAVSRFNLEVEGGGGGVNTEAGAGMTRYMDTEKGFSFTYTTGLAAGAPIPEGDGESIIFSRTTGGAVLQLNITPVDADSYAITRADVAEENPDMRIVEAAPVAIAPEGDGLAFIAEVGGARTREVWFVWRGFLFQISAPVEEDALVRQIVSAWQFL